MITVDVSELQYVDPSAGHDKFYRVYRWETSVAFQYGRNGTFGTFSRKSLGTVAQAEAAANKQIKAKYAKGYEMESSCILAFDKEPSDTDLDIAFHNEIRGGGGGTIKTSDIEEAIQGLTRILSDEPDVVKFEQLESDLTSLFKRASNPVVSPPTLRPMLANTVEPMAVPSFLEDDGFIGQYKLDGDRFVVSVIDGEVAALNRQGKQKTSNVSNEILAPFCDLTKGFWAFDGEVVGRQLWLFDMIAAGDFLEEGAAFEQRYEVLAATLRTLGLLESPHVNLLPNAVGTEAKKLLLEQAQADSREGIIFRRLRSPYAFGRRSTDLLKYKFIKEVDAFVTRVGVKGKDNAELAVYRNGAVEVVGQASTIGKGAIAVGDVLEVKFLYVLDPEHPRMFQPRIMRKRTDKSAEECLMDQFLLAGTNKEM